LYIGPRIFAHKLFRFTFFRHEKEAEVGYCPSYTGIEWIFAHKLFKFTPFICEREEEAAS
jgi:hypothetical protein